MTTNKDKIRANAQKFLQKGQIDKAIKEFQRLVEEDPKDVRTLLKIGDLETRVGDHAAATKTYGQVAQFYAEQGFFLKAVAVYKQILKIDPALVDVNIKLADLYHQLGLLSDASNQYRQISQIYETLGKIDESIQVLRKMVELDPENVASRIKLAEMLAKQNMVDAARGEFRAAATFLKAHHRVDDYVKVAERIVHFDPDDLDTTRELANIYIQKKDARRALAKLQVCFKANPKDAETLALLASAFHDLGQIPKTLSVYKELARIYQEAGNAEAFQGVMRKILDLAPDDREARAALGEREPTPTPPQPQPEQVRHLSATAEEADVDLDAVELDAAEVDVEVEEEVDGSAIVPAAAPAPAPAPPPAGGASTADTVLRILTEVDVYIKYGLKPKALEHIQKVFEVDPDHREARIKYKDLLLDTHDVRGVVRELWLMAQTAHRAGRIDEARNDLKELLGMEPQHTQARELLRALSPGAPTPKPEASVPSEAETRSPQLAYEPSAVAAEIDLDEDTDPHLLTLAPKAPAPGLPAQEAEVLLDEPLEVEASDPEPSTGAVTEAAPVATPSTAKLTPVVERTIPKSPKIDDEIEALLASAVPKRRPTGQQTPITSARPAASSSPPKLTTGEVSIPERVPETRQHAPAPAVEEGPVTTPTASFAPEPVKAADVDLTEELGEVTFFQQQGLEDEAKEALQTLLRKYPNHSEVLALKARLEAAAAQPAAPPLSAPALVAPAVESEPEPETVQMDTVDLASALAKDLNEAAADDDFQVSFRDVFDEFKKGVAEQVDASDYDTHYNLGIAYKEMGLLQDAVREFAAAITAAGRHIGALTMLGLCHLELGNTDQALEAFLKGINDAKVTPEEAMALRFEVGSAYESMGRFREACKFYEKVAAMDPQFRGVAERLKGAQAQSADQTEEASDELDALLQDSPSDKPRDVKADKISYL